LNFQVLGHILDFRDNQTRYSKVRLQAASTQRGLSNGATCAKFRSQGEPQSPSEGFD